MLQVGFPLLEIISMSRCKNIVKLWSENAGFCGFQNLRQITIEDCDKLSSLGHAAVFYSLVHLETLHIKDCYNILQVITEETNENEVSDRKIVFPQLRVLEIFGSSSLECFYGGKYQLELPSLKELRLAFLSCMNRFAGPKILSPAFFHETIEFPRLEILSLINIAEEVKGLWNWNVLPEKEGDVPIVTSDYVPVLTSLELGRTESLWYIPSMICKNLSSLKLGGFNKEVVFSSSDLHSTEKEKFRWMFSELPNLEKLDIEFSDSLIELFENKDFSADHPAMTFTERLKELRLKWASELNLIPLHLYKGLCHLYLYSLKWKYLISADTLLKVQGSLQQLEFLVISECSQLGVIIEDDVEADVDVIFEFPRLKKFQITSLNAFIKFSSTTKAKLLLPALELLGINCCDKFQQFWSGPIIAPRLKGVNLFNCEDVETLFPSEQTNILELPSLQVLDVYRCRRLRSLSSGPLMAPKLQQVKVKKCKNMQSFPVGNLHEDDVIDLPYLKEVEIEECDVMQSFSFKPVITSNLTKIVLKKCPRMKWLLSESMNHNAAVVDFPFLETVKISKCPNIQSICGGILQAPKLTHVTFNEEEHSMLEIGDLNQFIGT